MTLAKALPTGGTVGIVGGGTMGAGIAQVAAAAGHPVLIFDTRPDALLKAVAGLAQAFERLAAKGKMTLEAAQAAAARVRPISQLRELSGALLVIEAVVEDLAVKRALLVELEQIVSPECILATNTSALSITALAAPLRLPGRLAGMHFFNPAPVMELVEIVAGLASDRGCLDTLAATAEGWGKSPVFAQSTPGFILNRVARPYYGEALRLANEGAGSFATIDALLRECGGFRMGPFELMDFIGNDVNFAVTRAVWEAFFHDPRYRPSLIQQELVQAGHLGRKSGRGYFDYRAGATRPPATTLGLSVGERIPPSKPMRLIGPGDGLDLLATRLAAAGQSPLRDGEVAVALTDGRTASQRAKDEGVSDLVLIDLALDYAQAKRVGVARAQSCGDEAYYACVAHFQAAGFAVSPVADLPGMIVMRTVAMLANEALDAVNQGVCPAEAVDAAMCKGANYPLGPIAWARRLGPAPLETVLQHLFNYFGEERYRLSPLLRRAASEGRFHP